ncbi:hypothetical protein D9M68_540480 [compost metagenome]
MRMFGLQGFQLMEQAVVLGVRDTRLVEYVVAIVVRIQLATKFEDALGGVGHGGIPETKRAAMAALALFIDNQQKI